MTKRKKDKIMKQNIDKMYLRICKKYGLDPEKTLADYPSETLLPSLKKTSI